MTIKGTFTSSFCPFKKKIPKKAKRGRKKLKRDKKGRKEDVKKPKRDKKEQKKDVKVPKKEEKNLICAIKK